jgi:Protein of unknown function (DUF1579)
MYTSVKEEEMDEAARVAAAGRVERATAPATEYRPLDILIGRWMTTGHTFGPDGAPDAPVTASDIYEWAPGGYFILHTAYGAIGEQGVGGIEMIGYDSQTKRFHTTFFDSQGNTTTEALSVDGATWKWTGATVRCTGTLEDDAKKLICHHERLEGEIWVPSMDVTLTRVV